MSSHTNISAYNNIQLITPLGLIKTSLVNTQAALNLGSESAKKHTKWAAECEENLKGYFQGVRALTNSTSLHENSLLSQDL